MWSGGKAESMSITAVMKMSRRLQRRSVDRCEGRADADSEVLAECDT